VKCGRSGVECISNACAVSQRCRDLPDDQCRIGRRFARPQSWMLFDPAHLALGKVAVGTLRWCPAGDVGPSGRIQGDDRCRYG
jgi:hypothetical protein